MNPELRHLMAIWERSLYKRFGIKGRLQIVPDTQARHLPPDTVIQMACTLGGIRYSQLMSGSRKAEVVRVRHVLCILLHKQLGHPCKTVGRCLGIDHSTVLNACEVIANELATGQPAAVALYSTLTDRVNEYANHYAEPATNDHAGGPADAIAAAVAELRRIHPNITVHIDHRGRPDGTVSRAAAAAVSHQAAPA